MNFKKYGLAVLCATAAMLAACGGGGGGPSTAGDPVAPPAAPAAPDTRNGTYTVFAADGHQYSATVNFNTGVALFSDSTTTMTTTMVVRGTSTTQFDLLPTAGYAIASGEGFIAANDALIGTASMGLGGGSQPFVAARSFVTSIAEATGTYNMLGRDTQGSLPADSVIFTLEITAGGAYKTCFDSTIYSIANCPKPDTYTLTVSGQDFKAVLASTTVTFRIAKIGSDRVYLRAGANGPGRRFTIGVPSTPGYAPGTFDVYGSETAYDMSYTTDGITTFALTGKLPGNTPFSLNGTVSGMGTLGPAGMRGVQTVSDGGFFGIRGANIGAVIAARSSTAHPGLIMLGAPR